MISTDHLFDLTLTNMLLRFEKIDMCLANCRYNLSMRRFSLVLPVIFLLSGCGGGGGGSSSTPPEPTPQALADTVSVNEDTTGIFDVLANDVRIDVNSLSLSVAPSNGTASIVNNRIEYMPNPDFFGIDNLSYSVNATTGTTLNAVVSITVNSINDRPVATLDTIVVIVNELTVLNITANDIDIDGSVTGVVIIANPNNGTIQITDSTVSYKPNTNFIGTDSFDYSALDNEGAQSDTVTVSIEVVALTSTTLSTSAMTIPADNYVLLNHSELGIVFTSPLIPFTIPANSVSFAITLQGDSIGKSNEDLFIVDVFDPLGAPIGNLRREVTFCDPGLCSALVPRFAPKMTDPGEWHLTVGRMTDNLDNIDIVELDMKIVIRTGPEPDLAVEFPGRLIVKPFLTAMTVDDQDIALVLSQLETIANASSIALTIEPLTILNDDKFSQVSSDFNDVITAELVSLGDAGAVNIFFLESFSGIGGGAILGVAAGLPGTMGIKGKFNGVLISATALRNSPDDFYARTTAELAFHEMGHFLGLYHTTEKLFNEFDVISDTTECTNNFDFNENGIADLDECVDASNLMFWTSDLLQPKDALTFEQKAVIFYSPIARP